MLEMISDREGRPSDYRFVDVNAAFERQTGLKDAIGRTAKEIIPDLEAHWIEIYGRIASSREPERFEAPAGGLGRYYEVYAFPVEEAGAGLSVGALFRDIRERKEAEEQRELLTHELSHRVKNTLAVVQALARQRGVDDMTVAEYRDGLVGRVQALARAHDQLLQTNWRSADLKILVEDTLAAYADAGRHAIRIEGPQVRLTPKQGLGLALILHELATNASKYGSLCREDGRLEVAWRLAAGERGKLVHLDWQERGGPPVSADAGKGFGLGLIEKASSYELQGRAELRFDPEGLSMTVEFPKG